MNRLFKYNFIFFCVWPFLSLLISLRSKTLSFESKRKLVWLFCGFFGYSFIVIGDSSDISRYVENFHNIGQEISWGLEISELISRIYNVDNYTEPFNPIFTFIVSYFTDDHRILILGYGLIFGYYYSFVILWLSDLLKEHLVESLYLILFLYAFLVIPVWEINGIRMWAGASSLIYYFINYFISNGQSKFNLIKVILVPPFFHSGFLLMSVLLITSLVFLKLYKRTNFIFYLYFLLIFVKLFGFKLEVIDLNLGGEGSALQNKIDAYNQDEEYFNELQQEGGNISWFLVLAEDTRFYVQSILQFQYVWLALLLKKRGLTNFYYINLYLGIIAMIIALHPSGSAGRYLRIHNFMLVVSIAWELKNGYLKISDFSFLKQFLVKRISLFLVLFSLVIEIRHGFDAFNYALFLGNPFTIAYFGNDTPLIEFYHAIFGKFAG